MIVNKLVFLSNLNKWLADYTNGQTICTVNVFTIIHTISGNLQNNDYQKKESVRDEWALSAML